MNWKSKQYNIEFLEHQTIKNIKKKIVILGHAEHTRK